MSVSAELRSRTRLIPCLIALVLVAGGALGCTQSYVPGSFSPTPASFLPSSFKPGAKAGGTEAAGHILFVSNRDGPDEIYVMKADGSEEKRLTHGGGGESWPSFSPDGKLILYDSLVDGRAQVFVMTPNGQNSKGIATSQASDEFPAWSPDGSQIAFTSDRDGHAAIYIMNADGSGIKRLTDHPSNNWFPVWSPDGRAIVFISDRDGSNGNLFVMDTSGSHIRQVTTESNLSAKPTWAPDSQHIAAYTGGGIFSVRLDGSGRTPVTNDGEDPAWSLDGNWIAFASSRDASRLQIYLTSPDGSSVRRITDSAGEDWEPSWGP